MPAQPYVGQIILFAGNFAPAGWAFCDGQLMPISENETLFQLLGTTYGGDGQETFALPDLRGRVPLHMGTSNADGSTYQIGEQGGVETVTLTSQQIPSHSHVPVASRGGVASTSPANNMLSAGAVTMYTNSLSAPVAMAPLAQTGGNQPHDNLQPYLCVNYVISLFGVFPTQT